MRPAASSIGVRGVRIRAAQRQVGGAHRVRRATIPGVQRQVFQRPHRRLTSPGHRCTSCCTRGTRAGGGREGENSEGGAARPAGRSRLLLMPPPRSARRQRSGGAARARPRPRSRSGSGSGSCTAPRRRPDTAPQRSAGQAARGGREGRAGLCKAPPSRVQWGRAGGAEICKAPRPAANGAALCHWRPRPSLASAGRGAQLRTAQPRGGGAGGAVPPRAAPRPPPSPARTGPAGSRPVSPRPGRDPRRPVPKARILRAARGRRVNPELAQRYRWRAGAGRGSGGRSGAYRVRCPSRLGTARCEGSL